MIDRFNEKSRRSDLVVDIKGVRYILEMNRFYYKGLVEKNRIYIYKAASQTYLKGKKKPLIRKVIGINFDMETSYLYPKKYSDDTMIQFASRERERHYRDTDQFENYHVALFKIRKKYYNKEKNE